MDKQKPLQVYYDKDGEPGELLKDGNLNLGFYDLSIGMDKSFYIHNPNHNVVCDLSQWGTANANSTLEAPDTILPMETIKVKIKVAALTEEQLEESPPEEDISDTFGGSIVWSACVATYDDKTRIYGWKEYA